MFKFIIEKVGNHAVHPSLIGKDTKRPRTAEPYAQTSFGHTGLVEIDHDAKQFIQIYLTAAQPQRISIGFRNIE